MEKMKFKDDLFNFCPLTISLLNVVVTYELFLFMICKKKYFLLPKTNCGWSKHLLLRLKQERKFSTALIIERQLSRQKICQKFSVIITNTCVFSVFKTKYELKCQNELFLFCFVIRCVCFDYWEFLTNFLTW